MNLFDLLNQYYPVSKETTNRILEFSEARNVAKGTYVVEQGKRCYDMIFVLEGICRLGFIVDGKEETWAFGGEGDPWLSIETLLRNEPARFSLHTLSDCKMLCLPFDKLRELTKDCTDFLKWQHRVLIEQMYCFCFRQEFLAWSNAYDRYKNFYDKRPQDYVNQLPLKYVAQYLKMTPETISRLRKRKDK